MTFFRWFVFLFLVSTAVVCCLPRTSRADIFGIGDLPGGSFLSRAYAVSADGSVVVGTSEFANGVNGNEAFRWTQETGMIGLGFLPGGSYDASAASGVSADGSVIVGRSNGANGNEAFRWTQSRGMVGLGFLPGVAYSSALEVSGDGSVVVGETSEAFRWTQKGGMIGLGNLPGGDSSRQAHGVSFDGSVVVGYGGDPDNQEAFRWTQSGGLVGLGFLPGGVHSVSVANFVSADGSVVVGSSVSYDQNDDYIVEAYRWTQSEGMVGLGFLPGGYGSRARSISADGSVIVGTAYTNDFDDGTAFCWTIDRGMQSLYDLLATQGDDLSHWISLDWAYGASGDGGTIIGWGTNINGNTEGFVATIKSVPTPIVPESVALIRGFQIDGSLEDVFESDDSRMRFNPGLTINSAEAPVWLIFDASLPSDSPASLEIVMESQAGTPGLTHTLEAWNWVSMAYDVFDVSMAIFNQDTIVTVDLSGGISDYVQSGTGAVRTQVGWRKTGLTINLPWEVRLDQMVWIIE